ncbi:MAG: sigma 54-interacting transcriptional regulator [Thermoanaerobaculia bacterium]
MWRLVGTVKGREVVARLPPGEHTIGTARGVDVRLRDATISRRHAILRVGPRGVEVEDLGSKNGTWVDGERVTRKLLVPGDGLRFGMVALELQELDDADGEVAIHFPDDPAPEARSGSWEPGTLEASICETWLGHRLPALVAQALHRDPQEIAAEGGASLASLGVLDRLRIERTAGESSRRADGGAVLYLGPEPAGGPAGRPSVEVTVRQGDFVLTAHCRSRALGPGIEAAARCLLVALQVADERTAEPRPAGEVPPLPEPATTDPGLLAIYRRARHAARSEMPTILFGETGTGKELLARYIHEASPRRGRPWVAINCAALPRDLLEAELFGIERGVATGVEARAGRFEQAHGGTLFLDEIGDMPLATQAMILRVLQEREVRRIGGETARPADVLVLSATHRDLAHEIARGRFREDLYYRLAGWTTEVPPLRARRGDLAALASWFAGREARRLGKSIQGISKAALERIAAFDWPGNVRQLETEMRRAVAFAPDGGLIDTRALSVEVLAGPGEPAGGDLAQRLRRFERLEIERALELTGGDVGKAAERLGVSRATLYRRFKSLGIEPR